MCCAHIIECLLDSESSVAVLRFVSNRQRRLKVLQHTFAQQVQLVCIDRIAPPVLQFAGFRSEADRRLAAALLRLSFEGSSEQAQRP